MTQDEINHALDCLSKCCREEIHNLEKEWQWIYSKNYEIPSLQELAVFVIEVKHWE